MHEPKSETPAEPIQVRKRRTDKPPEEVVPEVANSGLVPQQRIDKPIVIFDTDNTQNYIMIILIALIQGSLDLCHLSYFYIYLYDLKTTPSELSILQGISILPWVFKPWFGFISDHFKFMGYHKKSYIFTVSLLEFSTHIIMFKYRFGLPLVIFCQVVQVGCVAFRNVIGEAIIVIITRRILVRSPNHTELQKQQVAQKHVSLFFGAKALGSVIAAWQSTSLMEFYGNRGVFLFSSVLPLVIMIYTSFIFEEYHDPTVASRYTMNWGSLKSEVKRVWLTLSHKEVKHFLLVVFLLTMTPSLSSTFNFFYTVELKFNLITMSQISLVASIAYLLSILAINFVFREIEFKKFYITTGVFINLLNLASLIIVLKKHETLSVSATFFCYLLNSMLVFTHELNFLPLLGTCCRLCPEDLEGTTYGLFTSMFNFGYYLATLWASALLITLGVSTKNYSNLWMVVVVQVVYGTVIIAWLGFLKFPNPDKVMEDEHYKRPMEALVQHGHSNDSDEEEIPLTKN